MSVLIKGMEMPKSCFGCHLFKLDDQDLWCIANHYAGCCRVLSKYIDENKFVTERHPDCPFIEVLTPHGRLGDLDELKKKVLTWLPSDPCGQEEKEFPFETDICVSMLMEIEEAESIIEAED